MSVQLLLIASGVTPGSVAIGGYEVGVGRTVPSVVAVLGLISVVVAGVARARSAAGRAVPGAALVLGLVSAVVGGLHAVNSAGGLGTGNGLAGAVVALVLGLIGTLLGGLTLARARRSGSG